MDCLYDSCSQSKPSRAHDENNRYLSTSIQYDVSRVHLGNKEISVLEYSKRQLNWTFVIGFQCSMERNYIKVKREEKLVSEPSTLRVLKMKKMYLSSIYFPLMIDINKNFKRGTSSKITNVNSTFTEKWQFFAKLSDKENENSFTWLTSLDIIFWCTGR